MIVHISIKKQKVKKSLNSNNTKIKNLIQIYYKSCNKKEKYSIMIELNFIYMNLDEIKKEKYKECRKNLIKDIKFHIVTTIQEIFMLILEK